MNKNTLLSLLLALLFLTTGMKAQERRPVDSRHPLWLVHIDVWNKADPQKIINLIPESIKPYVCMNLSLSCQYDKETDVYKMPQNAIKTYKSWASVCQANGLWFTCQPASGGHTHIQDDDIETFEYFYKHYPNFLGWNYAEQFWGFDETNDKSSSTQASRIALFAKLVPMAHKYGGLLTISFCGNMWSHPLNPVGMMKRNADLLAACREYPEAILWLYKYTTSSCFYNNESVTFSPFISGLAKNYGVRYDNCGWNGAIDALLGEKSGKTYPVAAGIGTVMEQTGQNGGAVWDGPELIWTEDFQNLSNTTVDNGYTRRNWGTFPGFRNIWLDMFQKIIDGDLYIPTREEVVGKTKVLVVNDVTTGGDEDRYASWGSLYDGLYKQDDPFNKEDGQFMNNYCYFKKTGRYGTIPVAVGAYDELSNAIPVKVNKSQWSSHWATQSAKVAEFNSLYPEVSSGDLFVSRYRNQLITYTPYTYLNSHTSASAIIPLQYNTCYQLQLRMGKLSSGLVREYADHIDFYLNNYRTDTTTVQEDAITIVGASQRPAYTMTKRVEAVASATEQWNEMAGIYVLTVKHMGPVDVKVSCAGSQTNRKSDILPASSLALDLPKQPAAYSGPIVIEAEDMDYRNIKNNTVDAFYSHPSERGHTGNGFVETGTSTSGSLRHIFKYGKAGNYKIDIRYMLPSRSGYLTTVVNGVSKNIILAKTNQNQWLTATVDATLVDGDNTFVINNAYGLDMYIDNVTYRPAGVEMDVNYVSVHNVEHGTAVADKTTANQGETVTLSVVADPGYEFTGWRVIHGGVTIASDGTFTMPDDYVTVAPIFADRTAIYALDYSNMSGNMPQGWIAIQENDDTHSYPNSYGSGARVFTGFVGFQGKGFYWREKVAEYGRQSGYKLTLAPGKYKLRYAMAAWKADPQYKARILSAVNDALVAESGVMMAAPNAQGSTSADLTATETNELEFTITSSGDYIIQFANLDHVSGYDEFLLLDCSVKAVLADGVDVISADNAAECEVYSVDGIKTNALRKGINIVRMSNGAVKKVMK